MVRFEAATASATVSYSPMRRTWFSASPYLDKPSTKIVIAPSTPAHKTGRRNYTSGGRARRQAAFPGWSDVALCGFTLMAAAAGNTAAQTFPARPIRLIVSFAPGGCPGSRRGGCSWGGDGTMPPGLWQSVLQRIFAALFAAAAICALPAAAQTYPSKPIGLIV